MLSMITGAASKYAIYAVIGVVIAGYGWHLKNAYDASVIQGVATKEAALNLATERADNARLVQTLIDRATVAEAQSAKLATIKGQIAHAAPSTSCIRSAPVRAAIGGLRIVNPGGHAIASVGNP